MSTNMCQSGAACLSINQNVSELNGMTVNKSVLKNKSGTVYLSTSLC